MANVKQRYEPLATSAYRIFADELPKQMSRIEALVTLGAGLNRDQARALAAEFHTIKGGAGFFGLDQIYALASKLETILLQFTPQEAELVRSTFMQFRAEALQLPQPLSKTE